MDDILRMEHITKTFPGVIALDDMSFSIPKGTVMGLIGENGAGKSTLIKILSGAYKADSGQIIIDGTKYSEMTPLSSIKNGISVIYQELNLVPKLKVYENIYLGKEIHNGVYIDARKMSANARGILESLGIDIDPDCTVNKLTTGFQQLVEVAKAIAQNAKILVLDEPTSSLSNKEVEALFDILRKLKSRGVSMVYISHRLEELFEICDEVTVMRDGKLIGCKRIDEIDRETLIKMMVGRQLSDAFPGRISPLTSKSERMRVDSISNKVVKDISFTLYSGEILGFAGLVGSGRTELVRAIFGADQKYSGNIYINGVKLIINKPADAIDAGIGLVPEDRKL